MDAKLIHLVCAQCDSINRIPSGKIDDNALCGRCKAPLLSGRPVELTEANFDRFIQHTDLPIVVDFWAPWCGPCRAMAPAFAEAAGHLAPQCILAKLNTDEAQRIASKFDITGIPCLVAFRGGREISRQTGAMNSQQILAWARTV